MSNQEKDLRQSQDLPRYTNISFPAGRETLPFYQSELGETGPQLSETQKSMMPSSFLGFVRALGIRRLKWKR